jgi:addiction module HigA family antidote
MVETDTIHPGRYIRDEVIPAGLTVTAAAKQLGVGRPALSNLLNGNAALSPDMAVRLEKTFGADSRVLLKRQADFERAEVRAREPAIAVRAYAPSVLDVQASQIEAWSERGVARVEMAALLRRLVCASNAGVVRLDFPAFDNAQRPGWDGVVQAEAATPWIPLGVSGWEFGVSEDPTPKANHDYVARTQSVSAAERAQLTFVFVTPRNWPGKTAWAANRTAEKAWKAVRAYDASDLEQWVETSIPGQAFFSGRLPLRDKDLLDLPAAWVRWAEVTDPPLNKALFRRAAVTTAQRLDQWLQTPPNRPFVVAADSHEEGLAALVCAFEAEPLAARELLADPVKHALLL